MSATKKQPNKSSQTVIDPQDGIFQVDWSFLVRNELRRAKKSTRRKSKKKA